METQSVSLTQEQREARDTRHNFYIDIAEKAAKLEAEKAQSLVVQRQFTTAPPIAPAPSTPTPSSEVQEGQHKSVKINDIQRVVMRSYNLSRDDFFLLSHKANVVWPRQVSMYLCKVLTSKQPIEIGRRHGGRDRSTVVHAIRKIAGLIGDTSIPQEPGTVVRVDQSLVLSIRQLKEQLLA